MFVCMCVFACRICYLLSLIVHRSLRPLTPHVVMHVHKPVYVFFWEESSLNYTCGAVFSLLCVENIHCSIRKH